MSGIQKLIIGDKEVLLVDYSDCTENEIITLASQLKELVLAENKSVRILSKFNDKNFATPKVMRHMEKVTQLALHLIDGMAIIGLSSTKKVILKGYSLFFKRDFKAFDTQEEAIAYLVKDS
ncbi:MAG TPA: STAS/SEC14 domain-containing protein [Chryseolinea sp.]|nr:STAS/SEC14 domain-containing protein [Chryseolinea sp.]HPH46067.1 STAS/SEC14 domain-containing protein [Chryseolinea sp.]HPM29746.1 STAS/SEC14 domain-containing protein [Chryseolinea sp.]